MDTFASKVTLRIFERNITAKHNGHLCASWLIHRICIKLTLKISTSVLEIATAAIKMNPKKVKTLVKKYVKTST